MSDSGSNNPGPNTQHKNEGEEDDYDNKTMKSSTNTSLIMPIALLLVLLVIPFSINSFMHMLANKNQFVYPVIMKIPLDNNIVTAPTEAKQFEGFDVKLQVNTQTLAKFINDIVAISSEGTSIQGVTSFISSNMQAEVFGENYRIETPGPQDQLYGLQDVTEWTWRVIPEDSGVQTLKFKMHVTSTQYDDQRNHVIELAEANVVVDSNPLMWAVYNWWIYALLILAFFGGWKALRRYNVD